MLFLSFKRMGEMTLLTESNMDLQMIFTCRIALAKLQMILLKGISREEDVADS